MEEKRTDHHAVKAAKRKTPGRLAKGQELEVQHLAETTGLSSEQAKELLRRHGNDWEKIRQEAQIINGES